MSIPSSSRETQHILPQGSIEAYVTDTHKTKLYLSLKDAEGSPLFQVKVKDAEQPGKLKNPHKWAPLSITSQEGAPRKVLANIKELAKSLHVKESVVQNAMKKGELALEALVSKKLRETDLERQTGLSEAELHKVHHYIEENKERLIAECKPPLEKVHAKKTNLPCDLIVCKSGHIYLALKKTDIPIVGKGNYKLVTKLLKDSDLKGLLDKTKPFDPQIFYLSGISKLKDPKFVKQAQSEASFLEQYQGHPEILQIAEQPLYYKGKDGIDRQMLIMQYYPLGSLSSQINMDAEFTFNDLIDISRSIMQALTTIHKDKYINRDLKSDNILLSTIIDPKTKESRWQAVLADFGFVCKVGDPEEQFKAVGTIGFFSPEKLRLAAYGEPSDVNAAHPKDDVWAAGIVLYELFASYTEMFPDLYPPHFDMLHEFLSSRGTNFAALEQAILLAESPDNFPEPGNDTPSDKIAHLIWEMLNPNPAERITAEEAVKRFDLLQKPPIIV